MPHAILLASLAAFVPGAGVVYAREPAPEEVWQLVRDASALYESLDAVDYDVRLRSPEIEAFVTARTGGLAAALELRFARKNLKNVFSVSFPELPAMFRARAEERVQKEANSMDVIKLLREIGWTLFGSFLHTVEAGEQYDVVEWNDASAIVEFNDLNESFVIEKILRASRFRFDRKRSMIDEMVLWFGGTRRLHFAVDYHASELFPGTRIPLVNKFTIQQVGFNGPPTITLIVLDGKYTRSAEALADETSTSWRARLKRAGFSRFQIDGMRIGADGTMALDFSNTPITALPQLEGLPVSSLNLANTKIADLAALKSLPLRGLALDNTPVTDLSPLAGMKLERLSMRNVQAIDLRPLAEMPLKKLSLVGVPGVTDLKLLANCPLEELDIEGCEVSDLSPLQGKPLRELVINKTKVADLTPLRGMPLERLECFEVPVADITPLAECRALTYLRISGTEVEDIRPLTGLKLIHLRIGPRVRDLAPLAGMPLRELFADTTAARDVMPLLQCRELERLTIPRTARNIERLAELPRLRELSFRWDSAKEAPAETAEAFWKAFDPKASRAAE